MTFHMIISGIQCVWILSADINITLSHNFVTGIKMTSKYSSEAIGSLEISIAFGNVEKKVTLTTMYYGEILSNLDLRFLNKTYR